MFTCMTIHELDVDDIKILEPSVENRISIELGSAAAGSDVTIYGSPAKLRAVFAKILDALDVDEVDGGVNPMDRYNTYCEGSRQVGWEPHRRPDRLVCQTCGQMFPAGAYDGLVPAHSRPDEAEEVRFDG